MKITPSAVVGSIYVIFLIMYIGAWMTQKQDSYYFSIIFFMTLIFLSPFIIRNFLNGAVIKYSLRRIILIITMFIGISIIIFGIM